MDAEDTVGHIGIKGELNIYTAAALQQLLLDALNAGSQVEVDLSEVGEMDCAGLQLLIAARREAARQGKPLRLTASSPVVLELLDLCAQSGIIDDASPA
jgi:anti-anti-sigma factor